MICGVPMFSGGLIGGWLYLLRPKLAQHPLLGFCLTLAVSLLRNGLVFFYVGLPLAMEPNPELGITFLAHRRGDHPSNALQASRAATLT